VPKMRGRLVDGQVAFAHLMGEDAEQMQRIGILGVDLQALPVELLRPPRVSPVADTLWHERAFAPAWSYPSARRSVGIAGFEEK